jgi:excisionase family DNA binding protein
MSQRLPALVNVEEAAPILGVSPATVRRWAGTGQIPSVRLGRRLRIDLSKIRTLDRSDIARLAQEARRA